MRKIIFIPLACMLLSACGAYHSFRTGETAHGYPVSHGFESEAKIAPGNTVIHRTRPTAKPRSTRPKLTAKNQDKATVRSNVVHARSQAIASELTAKEHAYWSQEPPAAREGIDRSAARAAISPSPGFKLADGTVIARNESIKVVQFAGSDLSDRECYLLTGHLTLHLDGTGVFKKNILDLGKKGAGATYEFSFYYYDQHLSLLSKTPNISHKIPEQHIIQETTHEIKFNMPDFDKIERVKISFMCKKEDLDNPSPKVRSLSTAPTPGGNQGHCNARAAAHKVSGAAYALLTSECLDTRATGEVQPDAPALANAPAVSHEAHARHDEQQRKWDATARRNINSICTGCTGPGRSPSRESAGVSR